MICGSEGPCTSAQHAEQQQPKLIMVSEESLENVIVLPDFGLELWNKLQKGLPVVLHDGRELALMLLS